MQRMHWQGKKITVLQIYIDYGSLTDVNKSSACVLASQFTYLPGQALLSKLSGLVPVQSQALASNGTAGHCQWEGEEQAGCVAH